MIEGEKKMTSLLQLSLFASMALQPASLKQPGRLLEAGPMEIPVLMISYYPLKGDQIDRAKTGDVGGSYAELKAKCDKNTSMAMAALEEGSRFRGYKDYLAKPSLDYKVVGSYEFHEAMPVLPKKPDEREPLTDYNSIVKRVGIKDWVEKKGVKEVWIWGYHGGVLNLWESNMSSPFGDVSNSDRNEKDLPLLSKTYTVYHYNYGRGVGEMLENHMHQLEHLLNHVDGRDTAPPEKWPELLFWGKFVGSDISHKLVTEPKRCGWTHYAPNSETDYDWDNQRFVESDIEDWKPEGGGKVSRISSDRWGADGIRWRVYWLQAIPGQNHGLTYKGKALRNWWTFVHDWDKAKREKWVLTMP